MKVIVMIEVMYDKRDQIAGLSDFPPGEVVVKRVGLPCDFSMTLEALCQTEGQKILDSDPGAASGFNHRVAITGFQIDGVMTEPRQRVLVTLKSPQPV